MMTMDRTEGEDTFPLGVLLTHVVSFPSHVGWEHGEAAAGHTLHACYWSFINVLARCLGMPWLPGVPTLAALGLNVLFP